MTENNKRRFEGEWVKLGDVAKVKTGKLDANAADDDGIYPFFTCAEKALRINKAAYDCECVLVAGNGDLNVKYYNGPFNAYQRTYIIESNGKRNLHVPYLYHFLSRYVETLRNQSIGGVIKYIKLGNLTNATFPLPALEKQMTISTNIDALELLINHAETQVDKLNDLVKSRFAETLDLAAKSEYGLNTIQLGKCCEVNPKKPCSLRDTMACSFIPMAAIGDKGEFDSSEIRKVIDVKKGFSYFEDDDVLFAKITPCMQNGKGAIARNLKNGIGFGSTEFHVVRPLASRCDSTWVYTFLSLGRVRSEAMRHMTGSGGQKRVPANYIKEMLIPLPPLSLQQEFADFVTQVDKLRFGVQQQIEKLETLKQSLMQEYFG